MCLFSVIDYQFEVDAEDVLHLFLDPPYTPVEDLRWSNLNSEALIKLLVDQHDFSKDRVENTVAGLQKLLSERSAQSKLDQWF